MGKTKIGWTDVSWPIVNGCRRTSPGCENCYAEQLTATRLRHMPKYEGLAVYKAGKGPRFTGETRMWMPDLRYPLRLRKPSLIFVCDMGDLFYAGVEDYVIDRVFGTILTACLIENQRHIFQILTKRSERMREYVSRLSEPSRAHEIARNAASAMEDGDRWYDTIYMHLRKHGAVHEALWLGVSVENSDYLGRLDDLLATPAAVRYVSAEPLLGELDLEDYLGTPPGLIKGAPAKGRIDWGIVGGESARSRAKARGMCVSWLSNIVVDFESAGVPLFVKQLGSNPYETTDEAPLDGLTTAERWPLDHEVHVTGKGDDPNEWADFFRVQQFPNIDHPALVTRSRPGEPLSFPGLS